MEFKEFTNPEGKDYDIKTSINYTDATNTYDAQLTELIGILDDVTEERLQRDFGISLYEYMNPNENVIKKVMKKISNSNKKSKTL